MNDALDIVEGSVSVRDGRIAAVGAEPSERHDTVIDAGGAYLLPGFIQTHIHLCQTLFRGYADDMPLLEWLRRRVWPMEAAHTP
ncbi:MAG TPA: amidohydrolase family protein, partial [Vicinamibacterales bacterium]